MGIFRQFPYSNFHEMNMDEILKIMRELQDEWTATKTEWASYKDFIDNYFNNLNLDTEVTNVINRMIQNGDFNRIVDPTIINATSEWLAEHITVTAGETVIDSSLTIEGAAADASVTGKWVRNILYKEIDKLDSSVFEKGSLNPSGADDTYLADARIRTRGIVCSNNDFYITSISGNNTFTVITFNGDGTVKNNSGWTYYHYIERGTPFRLLMAIDSGSSTPHTIDEIINAHYITNDSYYDDVVSHMTFRHGNINSNGGFDTYEYGIRAINNNIEHSINGIDIIPLNSDARFIVVYYNSNGTYNRTTSWLNSAYTIESGEYFKLILRKNNNHNSVKSILESFAIGEFHLNAFNENISNDNIKPFFEKGSLNGSGGNDSYNGDARIRTIGIFKANKDITITHNSGYFYINYFNDDNSFNHGSGWKTQDSYIPKNTKFRLLVTPNNDSGAMYSLEECLSCIDLEVIEDFTYSLDPNIILQSRNVDSSVFPPYSKYYIQASVKNQFDRVRVNVRRTPDGYYVLIHNNTINAEARNIDGSVILDPINSSETNYDILNSYDWGIKYGERYRGMGVPTLEEACKFASLYNVGMSIETSFQPTNEEIDEMYDIIAKYGLIENLIIITASGMTFSQLNYWLTKSEYIDIYVGGEYNMYTPANIEAINALKTDKNNIWAQLYPWGTVPTPEFIELCNSNGWRLYNSTVMSKNDLFNVVGFNKGLTLIETENIYNIKNTIRKYADKVIDE